MPDEFTLHQNYPNPFNPVTQLRYDLSEKNNVTLLIYDILGREVATLLNGELNHSCINSKLQRHKKVYHYS